MNVDDVNQYYILISNFLKNEYKTVFFNDLKNKGSLILRHDIDFDIEYARQLSLIEDDLGVKSTYFFLMHSLSYNILEVSNLEKIKSIQSRGHQVSIHFDPTLYDDIEKGFQKEKDLFEMLFDVEVKYTSIHRPSEYFLNNSHPICGVSHTYQPEYFNDIKYFSDSQGEFRYGNPLDSDAFKNRDTIQLLTHPIWWVTKSNSPVSKLQEYLGYRVDKFKQHMGSNCIPYKKYLDKNK